MDETWTAAQLKKIEDVMAERDEAKRRSGALLAELHNLQAEHGNKRCVPYPTVLDLQQRFLGLEAAIANHHAQRADDRCIEDDDRLHAAAGLPPCDRRVGDKAAMLENCRRFIERRCEGGGWPSYRELEEDLRACASALEGFAGCMCSSCVNGDICEARRQGLFDAAARPGVRAVLAENEPAQAQLPAPALEQAHADRAPGVDPEPTADGGTRP